MAHFLERLASFARVITFDKRGTGPSDRELDTPCPTLEDRMDDIHAVMDAVDFKKGSAIRLFRGRIDGRPVRCYLSRAVSLAHSIRGNGKVCDVVSDR
jgi:pimeloyl-ACP methyl ester carboxylesterase